MLSQRRRTWSGIKLEREPRGGEKRERAATRHHWTDQAGTQTDRQTGRQADGQEQSTRPPTPASALAPQGAAILSQSFLVKLSSVFCYFFFFPRPPPSSSPLAPSSPACSASLFLFFPSSLLITFHSPAMLSSQKISLAKVAAKAFISPLVITLPWVPCSLVLLSVCTAQPTQQTQFNSSPNNQTNIGFGPRSINRPKGANDSRIHPPHGSCRQTCRTLAVSIHLQG